MIIEIFESSVKCGVGNCNLSLDKYFAVNDPVYIGADYLKGSERIKFTNVRLLRFK